MTRLIFDPSIPLSLWFPLFLCAVALFAWYAWASRKRVTGTRRLGILTLMAASLLLPLVILLNPTWTEPIPPPPGKPLLTILVDRSASMDARDASTGRSRAEHAAELAAEAVTRFESKYELRTYGFDRELKNVTFDELRTEIPEGAATDLAAALEQSLRQSSDVDRPQGQFTLLLSDGIHNVGTLVRLRESLAKSKAMAAPIFTRTLDESSEVDDLELELGLSQEIAFAAQHVPVSVHLRRRGNLTQPAKLALKLDGTTLEEREVEISPEGTLETTWMIMQPKSGLYRYEISVEPLPGELTLVNNTARLLLRVVDEPVRVLLLEGKPYWDTKYLVRTLSADPSIELSSVVRIAENRLHRRTIRTVTKNSDENSDENSSAETKTENWTIETQADGFLSEEGQIDQYQIIVLGRDAEIFLSDSSLARVKKWLAEGNGSLVCFRGAPASQINERLGQLLPVRWEPSQESRFRLQMTPAGHALRWLPGGSETTDALHEMPSLATVTKAGTPKPLAVVLAAADESGHSAPAITYQPVGNGRVLVVEGAGMWRWAFLPPTYQDRDEIYAALWRSLVRWLVSHVGLLPSQEMVLRTDTTTFSPDETASALLLVRESRIGEPPEIELSGENMAAPRRITPVPGSEPGQYRLVFGRLPEGHYQARILGGSGDGSVLNDVTSLAEFDVRGNLRERLDTTAQPELMQMIARDSGGVELTEDDWSLLERHFSDHLARIHPPRSTQTPAWDHWTILLAVLTLWSCTWAIRRYSGLV